jgi:cell division protein FtsQ
MLPKVRHHSGRFRFGRRRNRRLRSLPTLQRRSWRERLQPLVAAMRWLQRPALALAVLAALGGVAYGARYYVTHARHFMIRAVRFSPTRHIAREILEARAGVTVGANLFAVDCEEIAHQVALDPWVKSAHARLELPSTVVVDIEEREPACVVALGALYLADRNGTVFKRAAPDEAVGLPVVTGLEREEYVADGERARAAIREAVDAVHAFSADGRPPIGEAHLDKLLGVTLFTDKGVGVRLGRIDDSLAERLRRFDAVWAALEQSGEEPRLLYLDNRARPDRVTVKLASAAKAAQMGKN